MKRNREKWLIIVMGLAVLEMSILGIAEVSAAPQGLLKQSDPLRYLRGIP